jgi:hypothetical protein
MDINLRTPYEAIRINAPTTAMAYDFLVTKNVSSLLSGKFKTQLRLCVHRVQSLLAQTSTNIPSAIQKKSD